MIPYYRLDIPSSPSHTATCSRTAKINAPLMNFSINPSVLQATLKGLLATPILISCYFFGGLYTELSLGQILWASMWFLSHNNITATQWVGLRSGRKCNIAVEVVTDAIFEVNRNCSNRAHVVISCSHAFCKVSSALIGHTFFAGAA